MKKVFALLLVIALLASLGACNSDQLTMRKLIDANQIDALLESYDSIHIQGTVNGEAYAESYLTPDCLYEDYGDWSMYLTDEGGYIYSNGSFTRMVFFTRNSFGDHTGYRAERCQGMVISEDSTKEKILSMAEAGEQITLSTTMDKKALATFVGNEDAESFHADYVVDAKTYGILSQTGVFTLSDGSATELTLECNYNAEMPEGVKPFLEFGKDVQEFRTITMVFDAGTSKERAEQLQVPKGSGISLMPSADTYAIYLDAACTEPFVSTGDYTSDVTIYVKWE